MLLRALEKAFEIPGTASVYEVGGNPVLTEWGFVHGAWNAPRRVLRVLFDERLPPDGLAGELTVLLRDGDAPVASIWVEAEMAGQPDRRGVTDAAGTVRFNTLPLDRALTVRAVDDPSSGGAVLADGTIRLTEHDPRQALTLTLSRTRRLMLRVVDPGGTPLDGVAVRVEVLDAGGMAVDTVEAASGAAGEIPLSAIPAVAVALACKVLQAHGDASPIKGLPVTLTLVPGRDVYDITVAGPATPPPWRRWAVAAGGLLLATAGLAGLWLTCQLPWGPAECRTDLRLMAIDAPSRAPVAGTELVVRDRGVEFARLITDAGGQAAVPWQARGAALTVSATAASYDPVPAQTVTCCQIQPVIIPLNHLRFAEGRWRSSSRSSLTVVPRNVPIRFAFDIRRDGPSQFIIEEPDTTCLTEVVFEFNDHVIAAKTPARPKCSDDRSYVSHSFNCTANTKAEALCTVYTGSEQEKKFDFFLEIFP
jgi:hypothetical protein